MPLQLWTIGHSTRPLDEFIALLQAHRIERVVDVRTIPRSRHNPQYDSISLSRSLKTAKLSYLHMPALGGLRKARKDSINTGWRNASFRGYADHMQTESFRSALKELMGESRQRRTVIMCAESVPWRCHRSLTADALVVSGWTVRHIMTMTKADPHRLTPFAVVEQNRITYPPAALSVTDS